MAVAARALDMRARTPQPPALRVVRPAPRRTAAATEARYRRLFRISVVVLILLTAVGFARVALSVKAMEAAVDAAALQKDLRVERLAADRLEADRSALATPSRIESIASASMKMARPADVRYLAIPQKTAPATKSARVSMSVADGGVLTLFARLLTQIQPVSAGDVGHEPRP